LPCHAVALRGDTVLGDALWYIAGQCRCPCPALRRFVMPLHRSALSYCAFALTSGTEPRLGIALLRSAMPLPSVAVHGLAVALPGETVLGNAFAKLS